MGFYFVLLSSSSVFVGLSFVISFLACMLSGSSCSFGVAFVFVVDRVVSLVSALQNMITFDGSPTTCI